MADISLTTPVPLEGATLRTPRWATMGVVFGLLVAVAIALYGPIGVSTTYPRFIGSVLRRLSPGYAGANPYLVKLGSLIKPESMLVVGLLLGGFLSAKLFGHGAKAPAVENVHARETTKGRRYVDAFLGGFLLIFGARLAGGCTSGHIISGISQLAISGMLFAAAVFGAGMITARILKGGR